MYKGFIISGKKITIKDVNAILTRKIIVKIERVISAPLMEIKSNL